MRFGSYDAVGRESESIERQIREGIRRFINGLDPEEADAFNTAIAEDDCVWTFEGGERPYRATLKACGRTITFTFVKN